MKKMILTEFRGKRAGFFRPKPIMKVGHTCPRCGSDKHVATTTCEIKLIPHKI